MLPKNKHSLLTGMSVLILLTSLAQHARATTVDVLVGNKNGFGFTPACPDTGTCTSLGGPPIDNRTPSEAAATNGAQITDVYSAIFPGYGPNTSTTADVILPFSGTLLSGNLSFAAGDFQANVFGPLSADINGLSTPFSYSDGRYVTAIHSLTLTASELTAANGVGYVDLHLDRNGSGDFIAFDYFELTGVSNSTATPEPSTFVLLATAVGGVLLLKGKTLLTS